MSDVILFSIGALDRTVQAHGQSIQRNTIGEKSVMAIDGDYHKRVR